MSTQNPGFLFILNPQKVIGLILHGGPIELFLVPTSALQLVQVPATKARVCAIMSVGCCI